MSEQQADNKEIGTDGATAGATNAVVADYTVGRGRPPKQYTWKKGQSGNPSGRRRKKRTRAVILEEIMNETLVIREGGKERKVTKYDALYRSQMAKAIKGDTNSAKFINEEVSRLGLGDERDGGSSTRIIPQIKTGTSEVLFADVDLSALSDDDKIELARLGKIIDLGGDFTALSVTDFARAKQITDKGRGKDVTPQA